MGRPKKLENWVLEPSKWFHDAAIFTIYTLSCPLSKTVKYVGVTRQQLKSRLSGHKTGGNGYNSELTRWIKGLTQPPIIEPVLEFFANNHHEACLEENFWIEQFGQWGFELLNRKDRSGKYVLHTSDSFGISRLVRIKSKKKL